MCFPGFDAGTTFLLLTIPLSPLMGRIHRINEREAGPGRVKSKPLVFWKALLWLAILGLGAFILQRQHFSGF